MDATPPRPAIRTPDQRLRVFVSSTLGELAPERRAARAAIAGLRLTPVLFELGARPHPPRALYRAYLAQSDVFVGIYWERYGWTAPGEAVSGLEDEYDLAGGRPKLIYVKGPAPAREERLAALLARVRADDRASYQHFQTPEELGELLANDLALLLTERFERADRATPGSQSVVTSQKGAFPTPRSTLVDRVQETAMARQMLKRDDVTALTLTGPGGSGKTRLALHVAAGAREWFADGARWVPLATLRDPALVATAIAQSLGVTEGGARSLLDTLKETLRVRHTLLVLDNFEQVVGAAPMIAELLEACPRLKVLATSRTPLHIRGEQELPVPPLEVPRERESADLDSLTRVGAVDLFVRRAREVRPDFSLTEENASVVAQICRQLDGLPLAIELAAARVRVLAPSALLSRLERRLPLLTGGARDLPVRQQTLRNTVAWSYDLLEPGLQALFRRLAVFNGGCTLEAAEYIGAGDGLGLDALDGLAALVDQSLMRQVEGASGEPRFEMLETIREFGLEKLSESGEAADVRRLHASYVLSLVERAEPHLTSSERWAWLVRLDDDHDNVRAAMAWSGEPGSDAEVGLRIAGALTWYWYPRGFVREGRDLAEGALARPGAGGNSIWRAKALYTAGGMAWLQGDFSAARVRLDEAREIAQGAGDAVVSSRVHAILGLATATAGDPAGAIASYECAISLARRSGDRWWLALTLNFAGDASLLLGDLDAARARYEQGLAIFVELDDPWGRGVLTHALGTVAATAGDLATARSMYEQALVLVKQSGDTRAPAQALTTMGGVALRQGDLDAARSAFVEGLERWRELGVEIGIGMCLAGIARLEAAAGLPERATRLMAAAPGRFTITGSTVRAADDAELESFLADLRAQLGDAAFEAAWADGRAMTLDEAIALAAG